ncbi:hypothetical protein [Xenorhabdus bovienii]|uniref:hypothetical protein n=1 Tax=Xenorhabdus bovienii TaxID=40576 RepID=UPI00237CD238|nr:hypothetical protein [Xenorhabdus bovienii]MDE1484069.1 hypothetical protein [Xenorhabdus bovienii]
MPTPEQADKLQGKFGLTTILKPKGGLGGKKSINVHRMAKIGILYILALNPMTVMR